MKKQNIYAIVAAMIWGLAFVAQDICAETLPPYIVNASRSLIAALFLLLINVFIILFKRKNGTYKKVTTSERRSLIVGGMLCGLFLTLATTCQQMGLSDASSGKAGFITALYIVIVPILGVFLKKKIPASVWAGVALAVVGLYFLCIKDGFNIQTSDILLITCAFLFSLQIYFIDKYANIVDGFMLSCVQFVTMFVLSVIGVLIFEADQFNLAAIIDCILPILFIGIFSSGVAYTLQIMAQKDANSTVITLLLSLESVFSVVADALIQKVFMGTRPLIGCFFMLTAVILAQLPESFFTAIKEKISRTFSKA